ncbi:phage holin family protein [Ekhidna sp.]
MNVIVKIVLSALAVIVAAYLLPGIYVDGFFTAIVIAIVLSLLNAVVKPLLILLTLPITLLTLGVFLLVINALIILLADSLISGFVVHNFWWALIFSLLLSLINSLFSDLRKEHQK